MIFSIPALQDTTIYESDPFRNAGLDEVLELNKTGDYSTFDLAESRILIKFDLAPLTQKLSENSITIQNISASLNLYTIIQSELPQSYTIIARPLAANWKNGSGYATNPAGIQTGTSITDGATWISTAGLDSVTWTASLSPGTQMQYYNSGSIGGGLWYTSSIASQSFSFKTDDKINIDITNIVKDWYNGVYENNGIILSYRYNDITASNYPQTSIQMYSAETHTVYEPQLYIYWTGSAVYNTGSMSVVSYEDAPIIYTRAFKGQYNKGNKHRILLSARPRYPRPVFQQNSVFSTSKALPQNSYYQIKDAHNDEIIIPYSQFTKINTNADGSYFDFYSTMMYPERYYKFEIKAVFNDITEYFESNSYVFKIVK
jgi:hypothetical protein